MAADQARGRLAGLLRGEPGTKDTLALPVPVPVPVQSFTGSPADR
jgi:hypothetical protein